ncbi:MAG: YciI family protein [Xanthomonadales bacterium]|nr:YciI family protein [Xanthomonadales bacterium]
MRFMILVKASAQSEAGEMPDDALIARMIDYHDELARAGVLLDASGLKPTRDGWRIRYGSGTPRVIDGPFTESKELVAGYTLIEVRSREEALEWTRRFPNPGGDGAEVDIEVRPLFVPEDFGDSPALQRWHAEQRGGAA